MKLFIPIFLIIINSAMYSQTISSSNDKINAAFKLAVSTIDNNIHDGILAAGADYGGEWTRDISINSWNCVSLLRPGVAEKSLWSVTINKDTIGHQYWDKIIWVIAALNHYKTIGDTSFLRQALTCSENTIKQLESTAFDKEYGLFTGGSVFNDGIAGYPFPIYDSTIENSSVLKHPASYVIKCLSTNCIYYEAYVSINRMGEILGENKKEFASKAEKLKSSILKHFYNNKDKKFSYVIDQNDKVHEYQEGLGISFAILFGIIDEKEAAEVIKNVHISKYGLASIYPDFSYFSKDKPGRHNNIVWPFINGYWALACRQSGRNDIFYNELKNLAAFGISIIIAESLLLFNIIKYAGAAYLFYVGYKMITNKVKLNTEIISPIERTEYLKIYRDGVLTNVLNPKVVLFFMAFLPQFINPAAKNTVLPFLALGATFVTTGSIWCFIVAVFASAIFARLKTNKNIAEWINKACGATLIGLGIKVALTGRK